VTEEQEKILNEIGYGALKLLSTRSNHISNNWVPSKSGHLLFSNRKEAEDCLKKTQKIKDSIDLLPENVIDQWRDTSKSYKDWDNNRDPYRQCMGRLKSLIRDIQFEIDVYWNNSKGGQNKNWSAYFLAEKLAVIYVLGLGKMPTISSGETGSNTDSRYCIAVKRMLAALDIKSTRKDSKNGDFEVKRPGVKNPCLTAKKSLTKNNNRLFNELIDERNKTIGLLSTEERNILNNINRLPIE
jgi:hypothetical protein